MSTQALSSSGRVAHIQLPHLEESKKVFPITEAGVRELSKRVEALHMRFSIEEIPLDPPLPNQLRRSVHGPNISADTLATLGQHFELKLCPNGTAWTIAPKIASKNTESGTTYTTFASGVTEERVVDAREKIRRYPDGKVEEGRFDPSDDSLTQGTRFHEGVYTFLRPKTFADQDFEEGTLCIGQVKMGPNTVARILRENADDTYSLYEGPHTLEELVFASPTLEGIDALLQDPSYPIDSKKGVLESLFQGERRATFFQLPSVRCRKVLEVAKELGFHPDLHTPDSATGKSLLEKHFQIAETVSIILELDPAALISNSAPYAQALLRGDLKAAQIILHAMQAQGLPLSAADVWISAADVWMQRAYNNDLEFADTDFIALSPDLKAQLYRVGNLYCREAFVARLNQLGLQPPSFAHEPGFILGPNMDIVTIRGEIWNYLQALRRAGRILTQAEYYARYPVTSTPDPVDPNSKCRDEGNGFVGKGSDFGRLTGTDRIQYTIDALGVSYPKTPFTIAVLETESDTCTFNISSSRCSCEFSSTSFAVKAQKIPRPTGYIPDDQESMEFLHVLQGTGYFDLHDFNIFITRDGAYFVDTEMRNFEGLGRLEYEKILERFSLAESVQSHIRAILSRPTTAEDPAQSKTARAERDAMLRSVGFTGSMASRTLDFSLRDLLAIPISSPSSSPE